MSLVASMAVTSSPPLSCWWRDHQPGSTRTIFHHVALVSVGPTLTTKSSWQVKLNSREIYQFSKNTYLGGVSCAGDCTFFDDILEFDPLNGKWKKVAKMMKKTNDHAVSTIQFESRLCNTSSFLSGSVLLFLPGLMAKWLVWGKVGLRVFWNAVTKKLLSNSFSVKTFSMYSK